MSHYYYRPIIARGDSVRRAGSAGSLSIGSTDIPVDSASSYFDVDDLIFVVDGDDAKISYCSKVKAVDSDSVTVCLPVQYTYDSGTPAYYVLVPQDYVVMDSLYSSMSKVLDLGIEQFRSSGGNVFNTQVRNTIEQYQILFQNISLENRLAFEVFVKTKINNGKKDFVLSFWDGSLNDSVSFRARLMQGSVTYNSKPGLLADNRIEVLYVSGVYI